MSHRQKLEQVLDLLINEEHEAASELLHSVIVEKARTMYEEIVDEEFGGDEKEDFADEIEADEAEIEADELFDSEEAEEEGEEEEAEEAEEESDEESDDDELEDRVEDLEATLAELTAEFERLMGDEEASEEEGEEMEFGDEEGFGDEEFEEEPFGEGIEEATKLQDEVSSLGMDKEGKFAGTGKNSKMGATDKEAPFTKAPKKEDHGGKPHPMNKGGDESGMKASQGKDHTPEDNIDVPHKAAPSAGDNDGDAGFAGTGKGSKKGAPNTKSTLGS